MVNEADNKDSTLAQHARNIGLGEVYTEDGASNWVTLGEAMQEIGMVLTGVSVGRELRGQYNGYEVKVRKL